MLTDQEPTSLEHQNKYGDGVLRNSEETGVSQQGAIFLRELQPSLLAKNMKASRTERPGRGYFSRALMGVEATINAAKRFARSKSQE